MIKVLNMINKKRTLVFKSVLPLIILLSFAITSYGQTDEKTPLDTGNLNEQFQYVKDKSSTHKDFKVIRMSRLEKLWANALDSLSEARRNLKESLKTTGSQKEKIDQLNTELETTKNELAEVIEVRDQIAFLGIGMTKQNYNGMAWSIILALTIALGIVIYKYKDSNKTTVKTIKEYDDTLSEYDDFKKRTLEKERKLKRELQTEINKVEDLKRRINS